ncbi:Dihydroorotate dehydrogenase (quinone), mitochondrial [Trapelia coarctata]|nr:Dihydroorotate dehydrogenase (quinone), mitochondrial [Trapelia coarctata]
MLRPVVAPALRGIQAQGFLRLQTQSLICRGRRRNSYTARTVPKATTPASVPTTKRYASTSREATIEASSLVTRLKNIFLGTAIAGALVVGYYYITDTRAGVHRWLVIPALRWVYDDAEDAHEVGTKVLKNLYDFGLHPRERGNIDQANDLVVEVFGHTLRNPIGTSAGIDKHAEIPSPLLALGPAVIEVGGATPYPQDGNPKPRVWRLPSQKALINRYGLNSEGADSMAMRLRQRVREHAYTMGLGMDEVAEQRVLDGEAGVPPGSLVDGKLMAVQVAKNSFTPDNDIEAIKNDYVYCVDALARYADIIVVNVSSPNTKGLRDLQRVEPLTSILKAVVAAAKSVDRKTAPAVMVKVSPDEDTEEQVSGICDAISQSGVDGVIVGNTTRRRPDPLPAGYTLPNREAKVLLEQGGYSGPQLFERTVALVKRYRKILDESDLRKKLERPKSPTETPHPKRQIAEASPSIPTPSTTSGNVTQKIEATIRRDRKRLKSQPLLRLPERNSPPSSALYKASADDPPALSNSSHIDQLPSPEESLPWQPEPMLAPSPSLTSTPHQQPPSPPSASSLGLSHPHSSESTPKVIFATGGITNGKQALEVLNAGASVAMVYSTLVFNGAGSITRIKDEMREEMKKAKKS